MDKLQFDIDQGKRAEYAHESYVSDMIESIRAELIVEYTNTNPSDTMQLLQNKLSFDLLTRIDAKIRSDITNGQLAKIEREQQNE